MPVAAARRRNVNSAGIVNLEDDESDEANAVFVIATARTIGVAYAAKSPTNEAQANSKTVVV